MALYFDADGLTADIARIFVGAGLDPVSADTVAESLVEADRMGLPSHGIMLADMYVRRLKGGSVTLAREPVIVSDTGVATVLDGRHGFGVMTGDIAMKIAVDKAKASGAGIVAVRHAFHFGAARRFALQAAARDCIGIAMCNTRPLMPAPGGAERVVGNNPLAIAMPSSDGIPFVLDMATSEAAMGKIRMAAGNGTQIPDTWAVRADGSPTTDPREAIEGMLLPTAGPKGFGLALMIDLFCGVLSGGAYGHAVRPLYGDVAQHYDCSLFFMAIDTGHFLDPEKARAEVDATAARVRSGARAPGVAALYTPGEPEWRKREAAGDRVPVDESVARMLAGLAADLGIELAVIGRAPATPDAS